MDKSRDISIFPKVDFYGYISIETNMDKFYFGPLFVAVHI